MKVKAEQEVEGLESETSIASIMITTVLTFTPTTTTTTTTTTTHLTLNGAASQTEWRRRCPHLTRTLCSVCPAAAAAPRRCFTIEIFVFTSSLILMLIERWCHIFVISQIHKAVRKKYDLCFGIQHVCTPLCQSIASWLNSLLHPGQCL